MARISYGCDGKILASRAARHWIGRIRYRPFLRVFKKGREGSIRRSLFRIGGAERPTLLFFVQHSYQEFGEYAGDVCTTKSETGSSLRVADAV